jgi:hypothetical protein
MRTIQILEMCQWFSRASFIVYMLLSVLVLLYMSSQTVTSFVAEDLSWSVGRMETGATRSILDQPIAKQVFPPPENNVYYDQLKAHSAERSSLHQRKFLARKDRIASEFDWLVRFQSKLEQYAAIIISETFSFLHVWKCGGTTVAALVGDVQWSLNETEIQQREWVAFVRDPIDRFLSAWAECGFRQMQNSTEYQGMGHHTVLNWLDGEYDFRVRAFLNEVRDFTFPEPDLSCHTHAHPQTNYMINDKGEIDDHVKMIGDLSELRPVLEIAGFDDFPDVKSRDASSNIIKAEKFPARKDLLKHQTLLELCRFYAMDYYLFDFEPPAVCLLPDGPLARYQ